MLTSSVTALVELITLCRGPSLNWIQLLLVCRVLVSSILLLHARIDLRWDKDFLVRSRVPVALDDAHELVGVARGNPRRQTVFAELCGVDHADVRVAHEAILDEIVMISCARISLRCLMIDLRQHRLVVTVASSDLLWPNLFCDRLRVHFGHVSGKAVTHHWDRVELIQGKRSRTVFVDHAHHFRLSVIDRLRNIAQLVTLCTFKTTFIDVVVERKLVGNRSLRPINKVLPALDFIRLRLFVS